MALLNLVKGLLKPSVAALLHLFHDFPNIFDLPQKTFPRWKNPKMAADRNFHLMSMVVKTYLDIHCSHTHGLWRRCRDRMGRHRSNRRCPGRTVCQRLLLSPWCCNQESCQCTICQTLSLICSEKKMEENGWVFVFQMVATGRQCFTSTSHTHQNSYKPYIIIILLHVCECDPIQQIKGILRDIKAK